MKGRADRLTIDDVRAAFDTFWRFRDQIETIRGCDFHLLAIPELDGSFIDSHELGKSYGTAMRLLTLKNCVTRQ